MPDWHKLVSARLAALPLEESIKQEVIAELASHFDEAYEALRREGVSHEHAVQCALSEVTNWKDLQRNIRAAKEDLMNARTARLWLPSFVTLALSFLTLVGFAFLGLQPGPMGSRPGGENWSGHLVGGITGGTSFFNEYTVWLIVLPLVGALGAHLSTRAGGSFRHAMVSGVFPAFAWLTIVLVVLSFAASLGMGLDKLTAPVGPVGLIILLVAIPGTCLLLGVLVYQLLAKRRMKLAA
jgi:hypothetical protein